MQHVFFSVIKKRLGLTTTTLSPEDEVNEFLERAIDARDVNHLKQQDVRPVILKFRKKEYENKVDMMRKVGIFFNLFLYFLKNMYIGEKFLSDANADREM